MKPPAPCIWSTRETTSFEGRRRMSLTFSSNGTWPGRRLLKLFGGQLSHMKKRQPTPLHNGQRPPEGAVGPRATAFG